jgi:hypothetical protein
MIFENNSSQKNDPKNKPTSKSSARDLDFKCATHGHTHFFVESSGCDQVNKITIHKLYIYREGSIYRPVEVPPCGIGSNFDRVHVHMEAYKKNTCARSCDFVHKSLITLCNSHFLGRVNA